MMDGDGDGDGDGAESLPFPSDCFYLSISMGQPARQKRRLAIQSLSILSDDFAVLSVLNFFLPGSP
jgi:hypothetical protein